MRDPDLVQRAEQAATELEQAWVRWRARHGLASRRLPPVSSYVGYSADEPWGQPRVILGVEASEAERLVAMLERDGRAGPGRTEPALLPEPRRPADRDPVLAISASEAQRPVGAEPDDVTSESGSAVASPAPAELTRGVDARLKDLVARVTALHPRREAHDQPQPEPTQADLAGDPEPDSAEPIAADTAV